FTFLIDSIGTHIIIGVFALAAFGAFWIGGKIEKEGRSGYRKTPSADESDERAGAEATEPVRQEETVRRVVFRAVKVFIFVAALILLGTGLTPLIEWYFTQIPASGLFWVNSISAVVDNATLTAAEIGPVLSMAQIKGALLGLLIAGGMLIPGNIPNIVAAGRLNISSREWAGLGLKLGVVLMAIYFLALLPSFL
ncbi:MAG TPA: DUF1646 family protein, partial [Methanomassiliicoccales archaeon]|nr:DUF1646 family protein [Methanomassiliicoccales archaeon]